MAAEENEKKTEEEDPRPLTDEEFEALKKKEKTYERDHRRDH